MKKKNKSFTSICGEKICLSGESILYHNFFFEKIKHISVECDSEGSFLLSKFSEQIVNTAENFAR